MMLYPLSKTMAFVFLLTLSVALPLTPAFSMESAFPKIFDANQEDPSALIEYYYANPNELEDMLLDSSSSSDSSVEGPTEKEMRMFSLFKAEADEGNEKAKLLLFCFKPFGPGNKVHPSEWTAVHEWLIAQKDDPTALFWQGLLAEGEWDGHPSDIVMAEKYYLESARKGKKIAYPRLAYLFHSGSFLKEFPQGIDQGKALNYYEKTYEVCGNSSILKNIHSIYKHAAFDDIDNDITKSLLKKEAETGDPKAQALYFYSKIADCEDETLDISEWPVISQWLTHQENDPVALIWLGIFAGLEWKGHPLDPKLREHYFHKAATQGDKSTCKLIANVCRYIAPEKIEHYSLLAAEKGSKYVYAALGFFFHYGLNGQFVDFDKAEKYYLLEAKIGNASKTYHSLGQLFHYGINKQGRDFAKAEKYYLLARENGNTSIDRNLADLYHHGIDGQGNDFAKAQKYYLLEAKIGDASWAYYNLGQLFHYGINKQGSDFAEAEKYYLLAIKAGNTLTYFLLGNLYQYGIHGQFKDLNKAVHMYRLAAQNKKGYSDAAYALGYLYQKGWENLLALPTKAVHYFIVASHDNTFYNAKEVKSALKTYCIPSTLSEIPSIIITFTDAQVKQVQEKWETAFTTLKAMGDKMSFKYDSAIMFLDFATLQNQESPDEQKSVEHQQRMLKQEKDAKNNTERRKQAHYENYFPVFVNATHHLSKVFEENAFCFITPKPAVLEHLQKTFKVYDPLNPTDFEEVGLCLYKLSDQVFLSFGNENVKLSHTTMNLLEGEHSLASLINHHRKKVDLLEKLITQVNGKLDEESHALMTQILKKPARLYGLTGEEPKPCFKDLLLATLQKNHGVNETKAEICIENKLKGIATNVEIDQCITEAMIHHLKAKITKSVEKRESLEDIMGIFKEMLTVSQPKKIMRFKAEYDFLGEMFE